MVEIVAEDRQAAWLDIVPVADELLRVMDTDVALGAAEFVGFVNVLQRLVMVGVTNFDDFIEVFGNRDPFFALFANALLTNPAGVVIGAGDSALQVAGDIGQSVFLFGSNNNVTITGRGANRVYGMAGDNVIVSTNWANSVINPGRGNNRIYGSWGSNTLIVGRYYGTNYVSAGRSGDRLVFRDDIRPDEVFLVRSGNDLEVIIPEINPRARTMVHLIPMQLVTEEAFDEPVIANATNRIIYTSFFTSTQNQFASITFPCGTVVTRSDVVGMARVIYGTDYDDILITPNNADNHIVYAFDGHDTITVQGNGRNRIYSNAGNDLITISGSSTNFITIASGDNVVLSTNWADNTIDPGRGNNRIYGTWGSNTLIVGRYYGTNYVSAGRSGDRLVFRDDIRPDEVFLVRNGNDLEVFIQDPALPPTQSTNQTTFSSFFGQAQRRLVSITMPCGIVIPLNTITAANFLTGTTMQLSDLV